MKVSAFMKVGLRLLPDLAALSWARRQAVLQERGAAGEEKRRWQTVVGVIEQRIREKERQVTEQLDVLKFKVKGEVF